MTTRTMRRKSVAWLLGCAAFVLVLAVPGCARVGSMLTRTKPPAPDAAPPVQIVQSDADVTPATPARPAPAVREPVSYGAEPPRATDPPAVNVFGEFDGQPRDGMRQVAEAGFQQHTFLDEGYDADVAVDPSGRWIVFASTRHAEATDLYMQRVDGVSVTQLTSDAADDANPVFSPDGRSIAFASTRAGTWDIYTMDADGRNVMQVTSGPMQDLHPSFSPDGTRLVYCSTGGRSGQWELWVVDLRTGEKRMIGFGLFPSWSPRADVDRIAFQRPRQRGSRWFSLWTLDLIDGEAGRVTEIAVSSDAALVCPAWSPDGRRIAFTTISEPGRTGVGIEEGAQDVWVVNADGTNRQRLTDGTAVNGTPFWGPNDRVFFVSDRGGTEAVWSVRAQSAPTAIADLAPAPDARDAGQDVFGNADATDIDH